jgi:hypothetical protein
VGGFDATLPKIGKKGSPPIPLHRLSAITQPNSIINCSQTGPFHVYLHAAGEAKLTRLR